MQNQATLELYHDKDKELKNKWKDVWDYFRPEGFEDILLCKLFELENALTTSMKMDECDDIIRYAEKYKKLLGEGKWTPDEETKKLGFLNMQRRLQKIRTTEGE